jgi:hypothetical protein
VPVVGGKNASLGEIIRVLMKERSKMPEGWPQPPTPIENFSKPMR